MVFVYYNDLAHIGAILVSVCVPLLVRVILKETIDDLQKKRQIRKSVKEQQDIWYS